MIGAERIRIFGSDAVGSDSCATVQGAIITDWDSFRAIWRVATPLAMTPWCHGVGPCLLSLQLPGLRWFVLGASITAARIQMVCRPDNQSPLSLGLGPSTAHIAGGWAGTSDMRHDNDESISAAITPELAMTYGAGGGGQCHEHARALSSVASERHMAQCTQYR